MPHRRVHQYRGGDPETYGGVTINIDLNWVDLGRGSRLAGETEHCAGKASFNYSRYATRRIGNTGALVRTAQCLLRSRGYRTGKVDGVYSSGLGALARRFRVANRLPSGRTVGPRVWVALLSHGSAPLMKFGSASTAVRRLQRSLNAADGAGLAVTGVFEGRTTTAVKRYQLGRGMRQTGVVTTPLWSRLRAGWR